MFHVSLGIGRIVVSAIARNKVLATGPANPGQSVRSARRNARRRPCGQRCLFAGPRRAPMDLPV